MNVEKNNLIVSSKKKNVGLILGYVIALVLLVIGGFLLLINVNKNENIDNNKNTNNTIKENIFEIKNEVQEVEKINDKYYLKKGSVIENDYLKLTITKIMNNKNEDAMGELLVYGNLELKIDMGVKSYESANTTIKNENNYQLRNYITVYEDDLDLSLLDDFNYMIDYESGYDIIGSNNYILKGTYHVVFPGKINDEHFSVRLFNRGNEYRYTDYYISENSVEDYVSGYEISAPLTSTTRRKETLFEKIPDVLNFDDEKLFLNISYLKYKYNTKVRIKSDFYYTNNNINYTIHNSDYIKAISFTNGITVYLSYNDSVLADYNGTIDKMLIIDATSGEIKKEISVKDYFVDIDKIDWSIIHFPEND